MAAAHMLKALFRKAKPSAPPPRVPDGVRVYAIGDIHGRDDLFAQLLRMIDADDAARAPMRTMVVLLGDLIDRGPDSAGVVRRAMALANASGDVRVIAGNHEEIFLTAMSGERDSIRLFARVGGIETLESYGVDAGAFAHADFDEVAGLVARHVPADHVAFLEAMEDVVEIGDYVFVHAGIRPGVPLADQRASDLRWIRRDFLEHRGRHDRFVIHGHTITEEVDERDNRIGIDTGAFSTGRLTAIALEGDARWYLTTG